MSAERKKFQGTPGEERALNVYIKLLRAANSALAYARVGLEDAGLSLGQFAVLEALYHLGPLSLGDLARRILSSNGNLTLVVRNLEKRRLVKRRQGRDKRMILARITPAGRRLMVRIFPGHARRISEVMGRLPPTELEKLGELCRQLGAAEPKG